MKHLGRAKSISEEILEKACVAVFLLMITVALFQVLSRFLPGWFPISGSDFLWTEELSTHLLIFTIFVGAALVHLRERHITISFIRDRLVDRVGEVYLLIIMSLIILFSIIMVISSFQQMMKSLHLPTQYIPWFRTGFLYLFILTGFSIIFIIEVYRLKKKIYVAYTGGSSDD